MTKFHKLYLCLIIIALSLISAKVFNITNNKTFLNLFAKYMFDEQYYITTYPEIKNQVFSPFEHFSSIGWREGKNPNKELNTDFYRNFNMRDNKYDLNPLQHYVKAKLLFKKTLALNQFQLKKVDKLLYNPKYYLALVAIFRNEARFLKEWIEFYRLLGVEHFYLYNHLSNDNFMEVLTPYIKDSIVDLYELHTEPANLSEWNRLQISTYSKTVQMVKDSVEWLIAVDTDEFLFPVKEDSLQALLKKYDEYASLSVNWRMFGSSKVDHIPDGKLLIETLTGSNASQDFHVKTIVKPRYVKSFNHAHFAVLKDGYGQVTENFEYFSGPFVPKESRNIVRINHYWARDYDFFKSKKLARVHVMDKNLTAQEQKVKLDALIKVNEDFSVKYDDSILRFVPLLRERLFETGYNP